jgi:putative transposase
MLRQVEELGATVGRRRACFVLGCARPSWYRWRRPIDVTGTPVAARPCKPQPRALSEIERKRVLLVLSEPRFCDLAPAAVYAILLDEGKYLGSISTYYRILRAAEQVRERRRVATHPPTVKPELMAEAPNQVWSWDITQLAGPAPWTWFYLYVILDIFSRYVVGWTLARHENTAIAKDLIGATMRRKRIGPGELVLHADRGSPMTAKPMVQLLADLGVTKSYSRPHTSNDNPFSEAQFKTMKYRPEFPSRFNSFAHAHGFCDDFFTWYNDHHYHSGIALLTPAMVHRGIAAEILAARQATLDEAYDRHPERFVRKRPEPLQLAPATYINPPEYDALVS